MGLNNAHFSVNLVGCVWTLNTAHLRVRSVTIIKALHTLLWHLFVGLNLICLVGPKQCLSRPIYLFISLLFERNICLTFSLCFWLFISLSDWIFNQTLLYKKIYDKNAVFYIFANEVGGCKVISIVINNYHNNYNYTKSEIELMVLCISPPPPPNSLIFVTLMK